jgi:hypothetical protein
MFNIWQRSNPAENVLLKSVTKELGVRVDQDRLKREEHWTRKKRRSADRRGRYDHEKGSRTVLKQRIVGQEQTEDHRTGARARDGIR